MASSSSIVSEWLFFSFSLNSLRLVMIPYFVTTNAFEPMSAILSLT